MSTSKTILAATLGRYATAADQNNVQSGATPEQLKQAVGKAFADSRAAGFDVVGFEMNPSDPEGTLKQLSDKLRSQKWDGLMIAYAIRSNKAYTMWFEAAVNLSREVASNTKLLFSNEPGELMETLRRNFPA